MLIPVLFIVHGHSSWLVNPFKPEFGCRGLPLKKKLSHLLVKMYAQFLGIGTEVIFLGCKIIFYDVMTV